MIEKIEINKNYKIIGGKANLDDIIMFLSKKRGYPNFGSDGCGWMMGLLLRWKPNVPLEQQKHQTIDFLYELLNNKIK